MQEYVGFIRVLAYKSVTPEEDLARQREELAWWIRKSGGHQVAEYIVAERSNEGELIAEALKECRRRKARLVIPSLTRTGQAKDLLSALIRANTQFIVIRVTDEPTRLLIDTLNTSAKREQERRSKRAKDSAKVANPKGLRKDGTPALSKEAQAKGREQAVKVRQEKANDFAMKLQRIIRDTMYDEAASSYYAVAKSLNRRRIRTASGKTGVWDSKKVARVLAREVVAPYELEANWKTGKGWKRVRNEQAWIAEEKAEDAEILGVKTRPDAENIAELDRLQALARMQEKESDQRIADDKRPGPDGRGPNRKALLLLKRWGK